MQVILPYNSVLPDEPPVFPVVANSNLKQAIGYSLMQFNPVLPIKFVSNIEVTGSPMSTIAAIVNDIRDLEHQSYGLHKANCIWFSSDLKEIGLLLANYSHILGISLRSIVQQESLTLQTMVIFEKSEKNMCDPDSGEWLYKSGIVYYPMAVRIIQQHQQLNT